MEQNILLKQDCKRVSVVDAQNELPPREFTRTETSYNPRNLQQSSGGWSISHVHRATLLK